MPPYDLTKLAPSMNLDPFSGIKKTLEEYGLYVALAVLVIEAVKFTVFLVVLMTTLIQEGIQGLIALIIQVICCASVNSYRKIRRNARKFEERTGRNAPHGAFVVPSMVPLAASNTSVPLLKPNAPGFEATTQA